MAAPIETRTKTLLDARPPPPGPRDLDRALLSAGCGDKTIAVRHRLRRLARCAPAIA
jgi:hypothetical protein